LERIRNIKKKVTEPILPQVNRTPVLAVIGNTSVRDGSLLTFTVRATDPDGNRLTYSPSNLPANFTPQAELISGHHYRFSGRHL
jgi:hypothetical protein